MPFQVWDFTPAPQLLVTVEGYFNGFGSGSDTIIFFFPFCAACLDLVQTDNDQSDYSVQRGQQQAVPV